MRDDFIQGLSFTDDQLWIDMLSVPHPFRKHFEMHFYPFARFFSHYGTDTNPVIKLFRSNHRKYGHPTARMRGTHCCKTHRVQAFPAVIQHDKKFAHLFEPRFSISINMTYGRAWRNVAIVMACWSGPNPNTSRGPDALSVRFDIVCHQRL